MFNLRIFRINMTIPIQLFRFCFPNNLRLIRGVSTNLASEDVSSKQRLILQLNKEKDGGEECRWTKQRRSIFGTYVVLIVPATTFALGYWQWERHKWKTAMIERMKKAVRSPPIEFPVNDLSALDQLEFHKIHVRGVYLYDRQFPIRWRSRVDEAYVEAHNARGSKFGGFMPATNSGSYIITPMRLEGTDLIIMINRGWLPPEKIEPELEKGWQQRISEPKELNALVRKSEKGSIFARNEPEKDVWAYKDVAKMAELCGAQPVLLDADFHSSEKDGPIGGQTNVALRNQHFSYMLQWFTLTAMVLGMWSLQFL